MQKSIKFFEEEIQRLENAPKINGCEITEEWKEQIKICESAKIALEKQVPKKPIWDDNIPHGKCPICKNIAVAFVDIPKPHYCYWCGQALDWGKTK